MVQKTSDVYNFLLEEYLKQLIFTTPCFMKYLKTDES